MKGMLGKLSSGRMLPAWEIKGSEAHEKPQLMKKHTLDCCVLEDAQHLETCGHELAASKSCSTTPSLAAEAGHVLPAFHADV